jgi:hypothetical protein
MLYIPLVSCVQEQRSQFEASAVFLDSVVTQVSAAHLQAGSPSTSQRAGILQELQALLQQASLAPPPADYVTLGAMLQLGQAMCSAWECVG